MVAKDILALDIVVQKIGLTWLNNINDVSFCKQRRKWWEQPNRDREPVGKLVWPQFLKYLCHLYPIWLKCHQTHWLHVFCPSGIQGSIFLSPPHVWHGRYVFFSYHAVWSVTLHLENSLTLSKPSVLDKAAFLYNNMKGVAGRKV